MKSVAFFWGIAGVLMLLLFAVYRLAPMAFELTERELTAGQWFALGFSVIYMAYAEGYRGFHRAFAPRVVVRALHLKNHPEPLHVLFAPIFCMGYIHATRRRQLFSIGLTLAILGFIFLARNLSQPWRESLMRVLWSGWAWGSCLYAISRSWRNAILRHWTCQRKYPKTTVL